LVYDAPDFILPSLSLHLGSLQDVSSFEMGGQTVATTYNTTTKKYRDEEQRPTTKDITIRLATE
jgi:hypothetical protein